jgi:hypothetical protein
MDKNIFFIFGTVRTRSTWFSNLFTYKDSFCYNEESRYLRNLDEIYERIERRPEKNVGFSDPEMFHYIDEIYEMFPNAKYLLLDREYYNCAESHKLMTEFTVEQMTPKFQFWACNTEYLKKNVKHHVIHFNDMDDMEKVKECWDYLLKDCYFDVDRFNQLTAMAIKVTLSHKPEQPYEDCIAPYFYYDHRVFKSRQK